MKQLPLNSLLTLALTGIALAAAPANPFAGVDAALKSVVTWRSGQDHQALDTVADAVVDSLSRPDVREVIEYRLIAALQATETRMARDFLCRQLRTIGSDRAVPALAALLTDPESSSMARYALERIGGNRVVAALEQALGRTTGALRIGCVNSLGNLGTFHLDGPLPPLLKSADPALAAAAADALGKLKQPAPAVKRLEAVRDDASSARRRHLDNALLSIAKTLLQQGNRQAAARIYAFYYAPDQPPHLRAGALQGLIRAGSGDAAKLLARAVLDADPALQANAIALVREPGPAAATRRLAGLLPKLAPAARALLLEALGDRGDSAATDAVKAAARGAEPEVRLAAIRALGTLGDAGAVEALVKVAAGETGALQRAARASLVKLDAEGVNAALTAGAENGPSDQRVESIRALAGRQVTASVPTLLRLARDAEPSVRLAALPALGALTAAAQLPALVDLLLKPAATADRPAVRQAVEAAFRRVPEAADRARPLLAGLRAAPPAALPELLPLFPLAATPDTLAALRGLLSGAGAEVHASAVRALADWPDLAAAPDLLAQARTARDARLKAVALRGYVRLAGLSRNPTTMYQQAIALSHSVPGRKMILAGLGDADNAAALDLVQPFLEDPAVRAEAGLALVQIADRVRLKAADRAKAALRAVKRTLPGSPAARRAQEVINELEKYDGYLLVWQVAGPYRIKGKDSKVVFDTAFPPEQPGRPGVQWTPLKKGVHDWDLNLEEHFGDLNNVAAYLRTHVWSPAAQPARLELSSDDAIKAWLNGKRVHANYVLRGLSPAQDVVKVTLRQGWNELMLKVVDKDGGWAAACRVRHPDGSAIEGLKVSTKPER